jgi:hypothetical protein
MPASSGGLYAPRESILLLSYESPIVARGWTHPLLTLHYIDASYVRGS